MVHKSLIILQLDRCPDRGWLRFVVAHIAIIETHAAGGDEPQCGSWELPYGFDLSRRFCSMHASLSFRGEYCPIWMTTRAMFENAVERWSTSESQRGPWERLMRVGIRRNGFSEIGYAPSK